MTEVILVERLGRFTNTIYDWRLYDYCGLSSNGIGLDAVIHAPRRRHGISKFLRQTATSFL